MHLIEPALAEDADAIATVHAAAFERPWTLEAIASLIRHDAALSLAARASGTARIEGFVIAYLVVDEIDVHSIAVLPGQRRRGIARQLMEALSDIGRQRGARRIHLEVAENNMPAVRLYAGLGFAQSARRKDYYGDGNEGSSDALLLTKAL